MKVTACLSKRTALICLIGFGTSQNALAAGIDRQLQIRILLTGEQTWHNALQYSNATTVQEYALSTQLHSDGVRYADNLLDIDPQHRFEIKQDFFTRQGLLKIKKENGGKLPVTPSEIKKFESHLQDAEAACGDDSECLSSFAGDLAALAVLKDNPPETLEQFLVQPVRSDGGGFLYFFGYGGCRNHIRIVNTTHISGMKALDRDHKNIQPFSLDRRADINGDGEEHKSLCQFYTITLDAKTDALFVENTYIPSPRGTTVRTLSGKEQRVDEELPVPAELLEWATDTLRSALTAKGTKTASLRLTTPLDGDASVLGLFDGTMKVRMGWSFEPTSATVVN